MSNTTNATTFSFVNALTSRGTKSELAQEVAINVRVDIQQRIGLIDLEIQRTKAMASVSAVKVKNTAGKQVVSALTNLKGFNLDQVIDAYKNYKNVSSVDTTELEVAELEKQKTLLEEVLAFFPEDVNSITVEEVKA